MRASHGLFIDLWRNPYVSDQLCAYGFDTVDATYAILSASCSRLRRETLPLP